VCRCGSVLLEGGQSDKVISEFAGVKLDDPKSDAELRVRVGGGADAHCQAADAATPFAAALAATPTNVRAPLGQVRLLAIDKSSTKRLARADQSRGRQSKSAESSVCQGSVRLVSGDRLAPAAALEQAIALAPACRCTLRVDIPAALGRPVRCGSGAGDRRGAQLTATICGSPTLRH